MRHSLQQETESLRPNEKLTGLLVGATVVITAWGLAGKAEWARGLYVLLSIAAAASSIIISRRDGERLNLWGFAPFGLFCVLVGISLVNLSFEAVQGAALWFAREDWVRWLPTTVDRGVTWEEMLPWGAAMLLAGALRQAAMGHRAMRLLWAGLLIHGLLLALVGVFFHLTTPSLVLGMYLDRNGYHFASFAYRNHWAAYVVILVALALGFGMSAFRRWLSGRCRFDVVVPGGIVALLLAMTLFIPGSRSGILMVAGILLLVCLRMAWVLFRQGGGRNYRWSLVGILILLLGVGGVGLKLNQGEINKHWERTERQIEGLMSGQTDLRVRFSQDTFKMAMERPIWGWGVGSFRIIFPKFQGEYMRDDQGQPTAQLHHAHNDWAEMMAEWGMAGMGLFLVPLWMRLSAIWQSTSVLSRWGGGMGCGLILLYAWVEFPLHNPAVLFLWITVLCTAAPNSLPDESKRVKHLGKRHRTTDGVGEGVS